MDLALSHIYSSLATPTPPEGDRLIYSVAPVPGHPGYFIGKDNESHACVLIAVVDRDRRPHAPIRLESLEVQFEVQSLIKAGREISEGTFTVVRCRSPEPEIIHYFLSVCETIVRLLGAQPTRAAIAGAINRLALIFQRLQSPPSRPVNGLLGELFLIRQCHNPILTLAAWRTQDVSRFDFSAGDIRLDVKTTNGRIRAHSFSYEQCNPPTGTTAIAASLFVERLAGGVSLRELILEVERLAGSSTELVMKLHDIVAGTLGNSLPEALSIRFDRRLAASSLQFYDLNAIPAIRGDLPAGVRDVHFRSDLSAAAAISIAGLIAAEPGIADFLPDPVVGAGAP
jgi:hypothetical protein